ncbi:MAG: hypothetical protein ACO1SX_23965 [Actinomycetota bacterium]
MAFLSKGDTGSLHVRLPEYPDASVEARLIPDTAHVFIGITVPRPAPNICTLALTIEQARQLNKIALTTNPDLA